MSALADLNSKKKLLSLKSLSWGIDPQLKNKDELSPRFSFDAAPGASFLS